MGYGPRIRWLKIKNPGYSQNEGRRELFRQSSRPLPSPGLMALLPGYAREDHPMDDTRDSREGGWWMSRRQPRPSGL